MKLMKQIISLIIAFLALASTPALAQVDIPEGYEKEYRRIERRTERTIRQESPDVILDPIESMPVEPTFYAMETGNWGPTFMGVNARATEIAQRAKRPVVVFIFDTGGCYDHPLLNAYAWNDLGGVFTGEASCADGHGHSTHVAGIVAASAPDYPLGIARMIQVKVVPVKVLSNAGSGSFQSITNGTIHANGKAKALIAQGWFVVYNYSLGGSGTYAPLEAAFKEAEDMGVLINVAANGNTGGTPISYPGRSQYTLGTAALQQSGTGVTRASYSSYGPETWGAAPGSSILSTWKGGGTAILSGTSMATPHQAGLFAILAAVWPTSTAAQLKAHYIKHGTDLGSPGKDDYYGYGIGLIGPLIDNAPDGSQPPPPPDDPTCTDGKQNGKETGVDCGGPDCPPCGDGRPPYRARKLPLALKGNWSIRVSQADNHSASLPGTVWVKNKAGTAYSFDLDAAGMVDVSGTTVVIIKEIGFEASSETTYAWEAEALLANANLHWRNRSLGVPAAWDIYDASRYILYFLDYFSTNAHSGYKVQALRPTCLVVEAGGVEYRIAPADLFDYKK